MKKLLIATLLPLMLTGCEKIAPEYQKAAELLAMERCDGVAREFIHQVGVGSGSKSAAQNMYYTCITDNGSKVEKISYKSIPVKYFNFEEN